MNLKNNMAHPPLPRMIDAQKHPTEITAPHGTFYWGGAGLDGAYLEPQLAALRGAGIGVVNVGRLNTATHFFGATVGTMIDAVRAGLIIRNEDYDDWIISGTAATGKGQFNLIGYSYGSLLAAQTANYYGHQGVKIDHLVLIASPISQAFLTRLQHHPKIGKVIVINLTDKGDPIYAGIAQGELIKAALTLDKQMRAGKGEGHFYYAHVVPESKRRWLELAQRLYRAGLR